MHLLTPRNDACLQNKTRHPTIEYTYEEKVHVDCLRTIPHQRHQHKVDPETVRYPTALLGASDPVSGIEEHEDTDETGTEIEEDIGDGAMPKLPVETKSHYSTLLWKYLGLENTLCSVRSCFCGFKLVQVHSSEPGFNPGSLPWAGT